MKILHIIANPKPLEESASKQVSEAFWDALDKNIEVITVDLNENPPPFYSYPIYRYFWYPVFQPGYEPTDNEKKSVQYALSEGERFNEADILVLTTPMWNFSVPAILKAWMDQVVSPGLTFSMGPGGVSPLHKIKKVIVLAASGGAYEPRDERDNFSSQIKTLFGFIGIEDVEIAWANGQNGFFFKDSQERKERAIDAARLLAEKIS